MYAINFRVQKINKMKLLQKSKLVLKSVIFLFVFFYFNNTQLLAQKNKYGLNVIEDVRTLQQHIKENPALEMVDLRTLKPPIIFDLKYATTDNFMHEILYPPLRTTWLRKPAAEALEKAAKEFALLNLGIKVFDAYRPYSVTEKMWEPVKDDRYAADPAKGSGHNRGISVDLTLVDLRTGKELNMPTGFDNFSDTAHQSFMNLSPEIVKNRSLLKEVMEKYGFIALSTEWWHFYLPNASEFELMNIPFKEMQKLKN